VIAAAAEYGAEFIFSQALRLGPGISEYVRPVLRKSSAVRQGVAEAL
jgi:hypothetical protein